MIECFSLVVALSYRVIVEAVIPEPEDWVFSVASSLLASRGY